MTFLQGTTDGTIIIQSPNALIFGTGNASNDVYLKQVAAGLSISQPLVVSAISTVSLVGASNGNTVGLLNVQGPAAPVSGTGAAVTIYSFSLPGNTLRVGTGIRISLALQHSTGSASVTYAITYGGQTVITSSNAATGQGTEVIAFFNIGTTSSQKGAVLSNFGVFSNNATNTSTTVDSTTTQTIAVTFSAANTEQVTPGLFIVELIQ